MTEPPPDTVEPPIEQPIRDDIADILAGNVVDVKFSQPEATLWIGTASCKHGATKNMTYLIAPGVPPLNHAQMVLYAHNQHEQLLHCDCPREDPRLNATVTFQTVTGVEAGQQRYIPQTAASIPGYAKPNLWWGPGLTCSKVGAYAFKVKVQLAKGLAAGARGFGVLVIQGVPVMSVPMVDEGGKATANIDAVFNVSPNQSIAVGYENTSGALQDVTLTTLTVSEVWVP